MVVVVVVLGAFKVVLKKLNEVARFSPQLSSDPVSDWVLGALLARVNVLCLCL